MKRLLNMMLGVALAVIAAGAAAGDCLKLDSICVDQTPVKNISGFNVTLEQIGGCWEYEDTYQCASADAINNCQPLLDKGCSQLGGKCITYAEDGVTCSMYEHNFSCPDKPPVTTEKTVCSPTAMCAEGSGCFDTSSPPDTDFGMSVAMMEASRQAGVYGVDPDKVEIFKGYADECSLKVLGGSELKSCCDASGGGASMSNNAVLGVAVEASWAVGKETFKTGSKYVYDTLYQTIDSSIMKSGAQAAASSLAGDAAIAAGGSTFGAYGFTFSFSFEAGFTFVGFDPASFALAIAIMLVDMWLSCEPEEQTFSLKKGQNLCVHVGTYCAKKVLGVCIEKKERHCCFNSILAKIINRSGRAQLGLSMDQCGGFTQAQLQSLDFAAMDFSEFIATIAPTEGDPAKVQNHVNKTITKQVESYYAK